MTQFEICKIAQRFDESLGRFMQHNHALSGQLKDFCQAGERFCLWFFCGQFVDKNQLCILDFTLKTFEQSLAADGLRNAVMEVSRLRAKNYPTVPP